MESVTFLNAESGEARKRTLRALTILDPRRWTPAFSAFVDTVMVDRMDELEHLHDIYSLD